MTYRLPFDLMIGTVSQFASARPFTATTGVDNNGDGVNNDRPVINRQVVGRYAFRGTGTSDVTLFGEGKLLTGARSATLRVEVFNLFNHANYGSYVTAESNTRYGTPSSNTNVAYQPRMMQLGFRATF
jgi:hypothetical protein